jgi:transitional endoplasmic reticulum ATPase
MSKKEAEAQEEQIKAFAKALASEMNGDNKPKFKDVAIERYEKAKILLPQNMTLKEGRVWLARQEELEETQVALNVDIDCFPMDGAISFNSVLTEKYGWTDVQAKAVETPFGTKYVPPAVFEPYVAFNKRRQTLWGEFIIPGIDGVVETTTRWTGKKLIFAIGGKVKRKNETEFHEFCRAVEEHVRQHSIYRGKAIKVSFRRDERTEDPTGGQYQFDPRNAPEFLDTSRTNREAMFNAETEDLLDAVLFTPIEYTSALRAEGLQVKRGTLLEGPYGTGKTLVATETALLCEQNGWTYIYLTDVRDLDCALELAKQYQPCVVFAEDVDRAVAGETRTIDIDRYLETMDGVSAKNSEVMVVLTTNDVTVINQAMLRPGRIDTVIHIGLPDAKTGVKLVQHYGRGRVDGTEDELLEAVKPVLGNNAAVYREVVDRSRLSFISRVMRSGGEVSQLKSMRIAPADILSAGNTMKRHLELLRARPKQDKEPIEQAAIALAVTLGDSLAKSADTFTEAIAKAQDNAALPR